MEGNDIPRMGKEKQEGERKERHQAASCCYREEREHTGG